MGFLGLPAVMLPLEYLLLPVVIAVILLIVLIWRIADDHKYMGGWRKLLVAAIKKQVPIILDVHPATGRTIAELGKKKNLDDPKFDTKLHGVHIDSNFTGRAQPMRFKKGLEMFIYSSTHPNPITLNEIHAIPQIIDLARKKFPQLSFLTDDEVIEVANTPRDHLQYNMHNYTEIYGPIASDGDLWKTDDLVLLAVEFQDMLAKTDIKYDEPTKLLTALKNSPSNYTSQDTHQHELLIERMVRAKQGNEVYKWFAMGMCALLVLIGVGVLYMFMGG